MPIVGTLGDRAGLGPLKQALHAYAMRNRVVASNIANAEVAGYQPRRVEFEDAMRRQMDAAGGVEGYVTDERHLPVGSGPGIVARPQVVVEQPAPGEDGGVDMEKEMVSLVENQLTYRLAVRLLDMKYNTLQKAIRGSSR